MGPAKNGERRWRGCIVMKKKKKALPRSLKVRRTWPIPPVTKVKPSAKKYSRKKIRKPKPDL